MKVINEVAPNKEIRIKNNNQRRFGRCCFDLCSGKIVFKVQKIETSYWWGNLQKT